MLFHIRNKSHDVLHIQYWKIKIDLLVPYREAIFQNIRIIILNTPMNCSVKTHLSIFFIFKFLYDQRKLCPNTHSGMAAIEEIFVLLFFKTS